MPDGNVFQIARAVRVNTPAFVALSGPSGSGKTRSGLELATGLAGGGKILVADTEGNRALHYADLYKFDHVEWRPPFTPERNAELIDLAEQRGYAVLVIDSESDEYEGEGGLQEIRTATNDEFWAKTKARHKHALINRMRRAKVHIIFCLRAEERVRISKVDGRPVVEPLGWMPLCEKRFMYEVQSSFMFSPEKPGVPRPIKLYDIHAKFFPEGRLVSRQAGEALAQWCAGGAPAPIYAPTVEDRARAAAERGKTSLQDFWKPLDRAERSQIAHLIGTRDQPGELTLLAKRVDENADPPDDLPFDDERNQREDPFGLPPLPRPASANAPGGPARRPADPEAEPTRGAPIRRDDGFWTGDLIVRGAGTTWGIELQRRIREAEGPDVLAALQAANQPTIDHQAGIAAEEMMVAFETRADELQKEPV
ncbi:MAG TPA: hypothetical protein VHW66_19175 [Stellaceae bacterium]|jgi:hypothetical protein|nr:hypothetical protein [Stellaceae bacterium]